MRDACVKWQQKESFIYVFPFSFFLCLFLSSFLSFFLPFCLSVCCSFFRFFRFNVFYYIIFFSFLVSNSYSVCYVFLFSVFLSVPLSLHVFNAVTYVSFGWRAEIFLRSKIFSYQVPNYTIPHCILRHLRWLEIIGFPVGCTWLVWSIGCVTICLCAAPSKNIHYLRNVIWFCNILIQWIETW